MKTLERMTNEEFLVYMINHSESGVLMQLFILEGAAKYAEAVLDNKVEITSLINGGAWKRTAEEFLRRVHEKYNPEPVKAKEIFTGGE